KHIEGKSGLVKTGCLYQTVVGPDVSDVYETILLLGVSGFVDPVVVPWIKFEKNTFPDERSMFLLAGILMIVGFFTLIEIGAISQIGRYRRGVGFYFWDNRWHHFPRDGGSRSGGGHSGGGHSCACACACAGGWSGWMQCERFLSDDLNIDFS
ncbi:MAG: hypothetical protein EZS28_038109, partial [Streblomastix strix]